MIFIHRGLSTLHNVPYDISPVVFFGQNLLRLEVASLSICYPVCMPDIKILVGYHHASKLKAA